MSFYVSTATFFLLHCDEWDRVVALPRHTFVTGATLLQLSSRVFDNKRNFIHTRKWVWNGPLQLSGTLTSVNKCYIWVSLTNKTKNILCFAFSWSKSEFYSIFLSDTINIYNLNSVGFFKQTTKIYTLQKYPPTLKTTLIWINKSK